MITDLQNFDLNPMSADSPIFSEVNLECRHKKKKKWRKWVYNWCLLKWFSKKKTLVRHIPRNISKFVYKFLKLPNSKLFLQIEGKRLNKGAGYGLEIPVMCTFNGHERVIGWIKSKIQEDIKLEQSMKNRCIR